MPSRKLLTAQTLDRRLTGQGMLVHQRLWWLFDAITWFAKPYFISVCPSA